MEKKQLSEFLDKVDNRISSNIGYRSVVFRLLDSSYLKVYDIDYLEMALVCGVDIEAKILDAENRSLVAEIRKPKIAVYNGEYFVGEVVDVAKGVSYDSFEECLTLEKRCDLEMYANIYCALEKIVRSTPDIVYPDICSYNNLFVSDGGRRVELIDYEGFQVGSYPSLSFSSCLGDKEVYTNSSKYCSNIGSDIAYFTKELDIRSLIFFYFRAVFNLDLRLVDQYGIDLEVFFRAINLNDLDIMHKVWKIFRENEKNEWLGSDVFRIADNYSMNVCSNGGKRLVRK